jgi:hypothetical protein
MKSCSWCGEELVRCRYNEISRAVKRDLFLIRLIAPRLIVELVEGDDDYFGHVISS